MKYYPNMPLRDDMLQEDGDPACDLTYLAELADTETINMLFAMFEASVPEGLATIKKHADLEDWQGVFQQAHKLKSTLGIIQVKELLANITTIEAYAKKNINLADILPMIIASIQLYDRALPVLRMEVQKLIA